ncbi:DHA2 family efflux MFS transporter permease subunit [Streptomyces albus]
MTGRRNRGGRPRRPAAGPRTVFAVLCGGFFMTLLDAGIVNVAVPSLQSDLDARFDQVLWVVNGYLLALAVPLIAAARLGDRFGVRRLYVTGLVVFTVASALCGAATDVHQLIAARVLQGLGAALLTPQTFTFITVLFPPRERGTAFGVWGLVAGLSTVAGPLLGGVLVDAFGWRWIFLVNLPVGALSAVAALALAPPHRPGGTHRIDLPGLTLICLAMLAVSFGLLEGERYRWGTVAGPVTIPLLLALGVVLMGAFVVLQRGVGRAPRRARHPLVPLRLFADRNFALANAVMLCFGIAMAGLMLPLTLYLQAVRGLSPGEAGVVLAVASFASGVAAPFVDRIGERVGRKALLLLGLVCYAAGLTVVAGRTGAGAGPGQFVPALVAAGVGIACVFVLMAKLAVGDLDPALTGAGSGVFNTTRQLGAVVGSAAVGALLQNRLGTALPRLAAQRADGLPPEVRDALTGHFGRLTAIDVHSGRAVTDALPSGLPPEVADKAGRVAAEVFRQGLTEALRETAVLPLAVSLAAVLCASALRPSRPETAAPEYVRSGTGIPARAQRKRQD